jgi:hypothetical protein
LTLHPDSHAYDVAIECAALSMIALGSASTEQFHNHMRDALREALYLRGAFYDCEQLVNRFEARKVLNDVVTRVMKIFSDELVPELSVSLLPEVDENAEMALSDSLRAVLTRIDEMCLSEG